MADMLWRPVFHCGDTPLVVHDHNNITDKGVSPLGEHLIETQEKEMLTWLLYLIWMESFWTQSNWL